MGNKELIHSNHYSNHFYQWYESDNVILSNHPPIYIGVVVVGMNPCRV